MVRTVLTWRIRGESLVGTCHVPTPGRGGGLSGAPSVGVLLLNAGPAPRSGNSDLSASIGDRLALRGFPVFRFDFAGLGDSEGPTPEDLDAYWSEVLQGRNDEATAALIERIRREFGISRVVVGGLCAAALPAVRALGNERALPAGLILLEPNLQRAVQKQLAGKSMPQPPDLPERVRSRLRRVLKAAGIAGPLHSLRRALRRLRPRLPRSANAPLVRRWHQGFANGVRTLVVVAAGQGTDEYVTRILDSIPGRGSGALSYVRVPRTNHLFTAGEGRDAVLAALERWVVESFGGSTDGRS